MSISERYNSFRRDRYHSSLRDSTDEFSLFRILATDFFKAWGSTQTHQRPGSTIEYREKVVKPKPINEQQTK